MTSQGERPVPKTMEGVGKGTHKPAHAQAPRMSGMQEGPSSAGMSDVSKRRAKPIAKTRGTIKPPH